MTARVDVTGPRAVPGHPPTGPSGGAFRFAPRTTGTYRLVSIEARGYASFEGEFGSSPVSFTSTEGSDISGVVLRLTPEDKARRRRRGRRSGSDQVDAGDIAPTARGSLRGRVFDARTGAPVVAFRDRPLAARWDRPLQDACASVVPQCFRRVRDHGPGPGYVRGDGDGRRLRLVGLRGRAGEHVAGPGGLCPARGRAHRGDRHRGHHQAPDRGGGHLPRGTPRGRAESAGRAALARGRDRSGRPLHP